MTRICYEFKIDIVRERERERNKVNVALNLKMLRDE